MVASCGVYQMVSADIRDVAITAHHKRCEFGIRHLRSHCKWDGTAMQTVKGIRVYARAWNPTAATDAGHKQRLVDIQSEFDDSRQYVPQKQSVTASGTERECNAGSQVVAPFDTHADLRNASTIEDGYITVPSI
jgi:hypothetical protein